MNNPCLLALAITAGLAQAAPAFAWPMLAEAPTGVPAAEGSNIVEVPPPAASPTEATAMSIALLVQPLYHRLSGLVKLRLDANQAAAGSARFTLDAGLHVTHVTLNGHPIPFTRGDEALSVTLPRGLRKGILGIAYVGRPLEAVGSTITQDVGPEGVLLTPDGHWFPRPAGDGPVVAFVSLRLPAGWRASGASNRQTYDAKQQLFHFQFGRDSRLAIAAGPYRLYAADGVTCFMTSQPGEVSLGQGLALLALYREHGVPASEPRTLVELPAHFAPVGAPGWLATPKPPGPVGTWLASLAWLPRAGAAGAGHNWLTHSLVAYTSDLLIGRKQGHPAYARALKDRLAAYENFLNLAPEKDVPLASALAPGDAAWEPVVLDKGALVWSLLHDELGDAGFWKLLVAYHASLAAGDASTAGLLALAGRRADFVTSWLDQPGLPHYRFADTRVDGGPGAYQVTGTLEASGPAFQTPVELALVEQGGVEHLDFQSFATHVPFHFVAATRPLRLMLDPSERLPLARQRELSIRDSLARKDLVVVYGTGGASTEADANREAALELAHQLRPHGEEPPVVADTALTDAQRHGALALVGRPSSHALVMAWENQLPVRFLEHGKALWWQGRTFQGTHEGVVQAIANPEAPEAPVVVVAALSVPALAEGLKFLDHRTTFCVYDGTGVVEEGEAIRPFPDLDAVLY